MAYPDEVLVAGERVVAHLHPHWRVLVGPVLAFLVAVGAGGYLAALARGHGWAWPVLAAAVAVAVVWLTVAPVVRWRTTHLVVTDRRVLLREGVLTRQEIDVPLDRVVGVHVRSTLAQRLVGCGTLVVDAESGGALELADVPGPERLQALLQQGASS